jgi:predicted ABC-type ATPase
MNPGSKNLVIIAGPNGSGKSTVADFLLVNKSIEHFINADTIARGLSTARVKGSDIRAGKAMLQEISESIDSEISLAFESTMAGRGWHSLIEKAQAEGYEVTICYIYLDSVALALRRVAQRVEEGGHFIPAETVVRRFKRSVTLFKDSYSRLVDNWYLFNNSSQSAILVAYRHKDEAVCVLNTEKYDRFFK